MAIDLPPVIPPQASTAEKIENYAALNSSPVIEHQVAGYTLRISGNRHLTEAQIAAIMAAAQSPAQAVNALNQAYYQLGHLLVTVYFAHKDQIIYAHVINGRVDSIKASEAISPYFESLVGDEHLTRGEFDAKRVLADVQSQRSGVNYKVSYQLEADPEAFTMVFTPSEAEDHDPTEVSLSLNNLGNRFLGRYFVGAGVKHDFESGVEFQFSYDRGMTEWGETNGGDSFDGYSLRLNTPSRWGLYGLEGRYTEYVREAQLGSSQSAMGSQNCLAALAPVCDLLDGLLDLGQTAAPTAARVESEATQLALTGEQILGSDTLYRLTLSQRIEYNDNVIDVVGFGRLLDEPHSTLELGLKYSRLMPVLGVPTQLTVQGFVEGGIGSDSGTLGSDPRQGEVGIGRRSGEFVAVKPRFSAKFGVLSWATLNLQFLSQFSDDTQLPLQQQFFLGGGSLSAYLPGILVGDSGTYTKLSFDANGLPFMGLMFKPSLFIEHGQAWYEDARGSAADTRHIADAGFGIGASYKTFIETQLIAAVPVADENIGQEFLNQMEVDFFWQAKLKF